MPSELGNTSFLPELQPVKSITRSGREEDQKRQHKEKSPDASRHDNSQERDPIEETLLEEDVFESSEGEIITQHTEESSSQKLPMRKKGQNIDLTA